MKKQYLFVYGSLMNGLKTTMTRLLEKHAIFLGSGKMSGQLYDVGHYPGAVYDKNTVHLIYGHIFELINVNLVLNLLDDYETVGERFQNFNEYIRETKPVQFENQVLNCWVYLYNLSVDNLVLIESGNYLENLKTNQKHRDFLNSV